MIKRWLNKILPPTKAKKARPNVLTQKAHGIDNDKISVAAERVVKRLQSARFEAFIVGGAVRDLLLGIEPKDFDIATNATPEEVLRIFSRSRKIGRRFPIVLVELEGEVIEVTTYRALGSRRHNEHGRIMSDSRFGTQEEDANRRDFTSNALYYNPTTSELIDYHQGVLDVKARRLVMIGHPATRYREDPMRMLRAARLAGKLKFTVDEKSAAPILEMAPLLESEPKARLFDEVLKMIYSGHSQDCLVQVAHLGLDRAGVELLNLLLPGATGSTSNIIAAALYATDQRIRAGNHISPGFVIAAMLWPRFRESVAAVLSAGSKPHQALYEALAEARRKLGSQWGVSQRFSGVTLDVWQLQHEFEQRRGMKPFRLVEHPRFRAAYDFLCLRAKLGEVPREIAIWWETFQLADENEKQAMIERLSHTEPEAKPKKRRLRRRKKKPAATTSSTANPTTNSSTSAES